jgi:hypothetical protein
VQQPDADVGPQLLMPLEEQLMAVADIAGHVEHMSSQKVPRGWGGYAIQVAAAPAPQ